MGIAVPDPSGTQKISCRMQRVDSWWAGIMLSWQVETSWAERTVPAKLGLSTHLALDLREGHQLRGPSVFDAKHREVTKQIGVHGTTSIPE